MEKTPPSSARKNIQSGDAASGERRSAKRVVVDNLPFLEPWTCGSCLELMYNKTPEGYPAPGAPIGVEIEPDGKKIRVCRTCAEMYIVLLDNPYMIKKHRELVAEQETKGKLKMGGNYLDKRD